MVLNKDFFLRDCTQVAPDLIGKILVHKTKGGELRLRITETEVYKGEEDTACHAHKGRTKRTQTLYMQGGTVYVYLCYGIHSLLNIVTGSEDNPQAVLIRACEGADGPGKLTKYLGVGIEYNNTEIFGGNLFIEDDGKSYYIKKAKRVGIDYASFKDRNRLWRFIMGREKKNV